MKPLYDKNEHLTTTGFLKAKFGTLDCPTGHQDIWRSELTRQTRNSHSFFSRNFCYVANKDGDTVLMEPFVGQAILRYSLDSQIRNELPGRIAEVKARQLGWTIENISRTLHFCLDENCRGLILVDDEDIAAEQALRLNTMLNGLPQWLSPMRRIQNLKHLVFDNPNPKERAKNPGLNSAAQITVPSAFRGAGGKLCVIIAEYAWMQAERQNAIQMGLISAIPQRANTILVYDTTPNGFDDSYYPMVMKAVENNPKWIKRIENWKGELKAQDVLDGILGVPDVVEKGYPGKIVPALCPWRFHEEYSSRCKLTPRGELRPITPTQRKEMESNLGKISQYGGEEEIELRDKYGVCLERLWWRRIRIDGYEFPTEEGRLLAFRQEFLSTVAGAFLDSGSAPFDRASMDALSRQERAPRYTGLFVEEGKFDHHNTSSWQKIRIYDGADPAEQYTMGVDTDVAYESPDSDATVATVVRFRDKKVVCVYEARVPSFELIKQLWCIYKLYNNCYYAIEQVGMGYDLIRRCIDRGMGNVHYYKRYDVDYPEPSKYPGWETNRITRSLMDQTLTEVICHRNPSSGKVEPLVNIPDAKTINEIRGLSRTNTGAFKSARGHDDHVDALDIALCIALDPFSGLVKRVEKEKEERKQEFNAYFNRGQASRDRNHPSLSQL